MDRNAPRVTDDRQRVSHRSLAPEAHATVVAMARALAAVNPEAARMGAFRSALVERCISDTDLPSHERSNAVVSALLADLAILVAPDTRSDADASVVLDKLPGLEGVAEAIRLRRERWDGSGPAGIESTDIPCTARLLAAVDVLIDGNMVALRETWSARLAQLNIESGRSLDPAVVELFVQELPSDPVDLLEFDLDEQLNSLSRRVAGPTAQPAAALDTIGAAVAAVDSIDDLLLLFVEQIQSALDATAVTVVRIDSPDSASSAVSIGDIGASPDGVAYHDFARRSGFEALWAKRGVLLADGVSFQSEAAWPLHVNGALWGALWAATSSTASRSLDANDLEILRAVAAYIEIAVTQSRRLAEFEHLAMRDPLTGLGNRRVLEEKLDQVFQRPLEARADVALIMCDVDGLKRINDVEGHAAGDQLLIETGKALSTAAATIGNHTVCRIGGDEFCIVLDGVGPLAAYPIAELACELFEDSGAGRSLSYGVAVASADIDDPRALLRRADEAQYEHKRFRKGLPLIDLGADDSERRKVRRPL